MHLLPASLLLAATGFGLAVVVPSHDQRRSGVISERTFNTAVESEGDMSIVPRAEEKADVAVEVKLTTDNTCGNKINGNDQGFTCDAKLDAGGACCSTNGNCGNGLLYCGLGCQPLFGDCDGAPSTDSKVPETPASNDSSPNPSFRAVSQVTNGAPTIIRCGSGFSNAVCPRFLCCSAEGYCGDSPAHCQVPGSCQKAFGRCDSDGIPLGVSTSSDARPLLGEVSYEEPILRCTKTGTMALTFDDGPSEFTGELLDLLEEYGAKATFFIGGNINGRGQIDTTTKWFKLIQRAVDYGHQIGSHTFSHVHLSKVSSELRKTELLKNERSLSNILGKYPTYMRAPYNDCSKESGCWEDMKALGYHMIGTEVNTADYKNPSRGEIRKSLDIVSKAMADAPQDGSLLSTQHDTIAQSALTLTEHSLKLIHDKGWKAVTVGECLDDPAANWYRDSSYLAPATLAPGDACIVSRGKFCGTISDFWDKKTCYESAGQCQRQAIECPRLEGTDRDGCGKFMSICRLQIAFCTSCGWNNYSSCDIEKFKYKIA